MQIALPYDRRVIDVEVPKDAVVLRTSYPAATESAAEPVAAAVVKPIGGLPLSEALLHRRKGEVVIVVSDVTRPIPYHEC